MKKVNRFGFRGCNETAGESSMGNFLDINMIQLFRTGPYTPTTDRFRMRS